MRVAVIIDANGVFVTLCICFLLNCELFAAVILSNEYRYQIFPNGAIS